MSTSSSKGETRISGASNITRKEKEYKAWKKANNNASRRHSMSDCPAPRMENLRGLSDGLLPKMPFCNNGTDSNGNRCVAPGNDVVASSRKNVVDNVLRKELGPSTPAVATRRMSSHNVRPKFVAPKGSSSSHNDHDASANSVSSKQSSSINTSRSSQKSSSSSSRRNINRAAPPPPPAARTRNNKKDADPHGTMPQWKERRRHSMSDCAPPNFTTSCPQLPIDTRDEDGSARKVEMANVNNIRTSAPPRKQTYGRRNSDFGPRYVSPIRSPFVEKKSYFVNENGDPIVHGTASPFAEKKSTLPTSVASANNKNSIPSGVENVDYSKWGAALKRYQHEQKERVSTEGLKQKSGTTIPKPIRGVPRRKSSTHTEGEDGSISGVSISMSSHASTVSSMSNTDSVMRQYKRRELKARLGDSATVLMEEEGEGSAEFPPSFCSNRPGRPTGNCEDNKEEQNKPTKKLNLPGYFRKRSNNTPVTLSCSSSDRSASMSTNHNTSSTSLRNVSNVDQLNDNIYIQVRPRNASLDDSVSSLEVSMRSSHLEYSPRKEMAGHIDGINERNAIRSSQRRASFSGIQVPWLPTESTEEECVSPTSSDARGFDQDLVAERKFYGRVKSVGEALKVSQIKVGEGKKDKGPEAANYFCKDRRRLSDCGITYGRPDMKMFNTDIANSWRQSLNNDSRDNHRTSSESLLTEDQEQGYSDTLRQMIQDHQDFLSNVGGRYNNGEGRVSTGPTSRELETTSSDSKAAGDNSKGFSQGNRVDSDDYAGMLKKIWYQPNRKKWHRRGQQ